LEKVLGEKEQPERSWLSQRVEEIPRFGEKMIGKSLPSIAWGRREEKVRKGHGYQSLREKIGRRYSGFQKCLKGS
jgi:hypothetical protein